MDKSPTLPEIKLLDEHSLFELINERSIWSRSSNLSSILIFAHNGALLAHAHRDQHPIRLARTESATFSAAYISYMNGHRDRTHSETTSDKDETRELADSGPIIYESRTSNHMTIITPIAPKILLAVTGSIPPEEVPSRAENPADALSATTSLPASPSPPHSSEHSGTNGYLGPPRSLLEELGFTSEQLASVLREEMRGMWWPDGA